MNTIREAIDTFISNHLDFLEFTDGLKVVLLTKSSYLIQGRDDDRIGEWVKHHQPDLIDIGKKHDLDIYVIIEQHDKLDTSPFVYVLISEKGDKSGILEVQRIETGRKGVFISDIDKMPYFDDFVKKSAMSKAILASDSNVLTTHTLTAEGTQADIKYCSLESINTSDNTEGQMSQMVKLTVVGIRNHCPGGEKGLPNLFTRLPIGSELYMRINPSGSKYPGAVTVIDNLGKEVGNIAKTDRRFIELAIPKEGMLPCRVVEHSLEDLCLYVEAVNNVGIKEPYIRETTIEDGETVFGLTEHDIRIQTMTQLLLTQLNSKNPNEEQILKLAKEYAKICCSSLDGDTTFARDEILRSLDKFNKDRGIFNSVRKDIFEKTKDLGRKYNDVKKRVYLNQYKRIFTSAYAKKGNKPSELEAYMDTLKFKNGGILTKEVMNSEIKKLSEQLSREFMNNYVKACESDEDFATALYSLNYSLRSIYVLYTRRIKREYLLKQLDANKLSESQEPEETKYPEITDDNRAFFVNELWITDGKVGEKRQKGVLPKDQLFHKIHELTAEWNPSKRGSARKWRILYIFLKEVGYFKIEVKERYCDFVETVIRYCFPNVTDTYNDNLTKINIDKDYIAWSKSDKQIYDQLKKELPIEKITSVKQD